VTCSIERVHRPGHHRERSQAQRGHDRGQGAAGRAPRVPGRCAGALARGLRRGRGLPRAQAAPRVSGAGARAELRAPSVALAGWVVTGECRC